MTPRKEVRTAYAVSRESVLAKLTRLTEYYLDPKIRELSDKTWGHVWATNEVDKELTELMKFLRLPLE